MSLGLQSFWAKSGALRECREEVGGAKMEEEKDWMVGKSKKALRCGFRHCLSSFSLKVLSEDRISQPKALSDLMSEGFLSA